MPLTSKTIPDLRLYPDERFRCLNQSLSRPRAFHTATLLPNGEVLVVGGLTPTPDAADEVFGAAPVFITSEAEVYHPSTGAFVAVGEDDSPVPRAFHQAAFIGTTDDGKYQVLLVGGATADPTMQAFGVNTGAAPGTRLVPFDTSGPSPSARRRRRTGGALDLQPGRSHGDAHADRGFTPGAYQGAAQFGDGIAVAGGIDWMNMPLQATIPTINRVEVSRAQETPRFVALPSPRMGATMTALTDDVALVWGGQITPTDPAGDFITGLGEEHPQGHGGDAGDGAADAVPLGDDPAPDPTTTNRTIIVTGGFVETTMNMGQALQPPAPMMAARLLTVTTTGMVSQSSPMLATYTLDPTCIDPARYRPAGWQSPVDLGRGRVLISGGAPTVSGTCNDCDDGGSDFRCSTAQASLVHRAVDAGAGEGDPADPALRAQLDADARRQRAHRRRRHRGGGDAAHPARRRGLQPAADRARLRPSSGNPDPDDPSPAT